MKTKSLQLNSMRESRNEKIGKDVRFESKVQFLHCACDYGPKPKQVASLMLMITEISERHGCAIIYTHIITSLSLLSLIQTF